MSAATSEAVRTADPTASPVRDRTVADQVGRVLAEAGVRQVFGVVGSGNFVVTEALRAHGAAFVAARHETGATVMADVHARSTGEVTVVSLHQGCGFTNALTGIAEASKSHTPLVVVTGETPASQPLSNFAVDQEALTRGVGAEFLRPSTPADAARTARLAVARARDERRTVVLSLPLDVQASPASADDGAGDVPQVEAARPSAEDVDQLRATLVAARRPVFVLGRGALGAVRELRELARRTGALLATTAVARGTVEGDEWHVGVAGGFGTPTAQDLLRGADVVVAWGASLNRWTTLDGALLEAAHVVQVDDRSEALGLHRPVDHPVLADVAATATALLELGSPVREGYRTPDVTARLSVGRRWRDVPYDDNTTATTIDPRTLTHALDELLPAERVVVTDVGNFSGWPAMFLSVPDPAGYCLPLAFQCVGLGLAAAVGLATAQPERTVVCGVGDGGFHMGLAELDTAVRTRADVVVVVYNDHAYGAEVHHFAGEGAGAPDLATVVFPETDVASVARGIGADALTVTSLDDLAGLRLRLSRRRHGPLVVDARITPTPSWMLAHAFVGETSTP